MKFQELTQGRPPNMRTITSKVLGLSFLLALILSVLGTIPAHAGVFELGGSFSYHRSNYNSGSYNQTQTWTGSLGYYLTQESEIEFMYSDTITRSFVANIQDLTYHDRMYSLNLLYHFFDPQAQFKPYLRSGIGQLNRDATGTYSSGARPVGRLDQVTVVLGFGVKFRITSQLGLKAEATSYMAGGAVSTWKDNIALSVGGSFYF